MKKPYVQKHYKLLLDDCEWAGDFAVFTASPERKYETERVFTEEDDEYKNGPQGQAVNLAMSNGESGARVTLTIKSCEALVKWLEEVIKDAKNMPLVGKKK